MVVVTPSNNMRNKTNESARAPQPESPDMFADPPRLRRSPPAGRPAKLHDTTRRQTQPETLLQAASRATDPALTKGSYKNQDPKSLLGSISLSWNRLLSSEP
jgi:hypothetical protein